MTSARKKSETLTAVGSSVLLCDSSHGPSKHRSDRLQKHAADPRLPPPTPKSAQPGDRPAANRTNPAPRSGRVEPRRKTTDAPEQTVADHSCSLRITIKLTDRRPDDDVIRPNNVEQPVAQAEAESGAAVRVERFVRRHHTPRINSRLNAHAAIRRPSEKEYDPLLLTLYGLVPPRVYRTP